MSIQHIEKALSIVSETGHFIIATADRNGLPHVAVGQGIVQGDKEDMLKVSCRSCPGTVANIHKNDRIALVAWDAKEDSGHQLVGRVRELGENGVQEQQLKIRVEQVFDFSGAPHSDEELS